MQVHCVLQGTCACSTEMASAKCFRLEFVLCASFLPMRHRWMQSLTGTLYLPTSETEQSAIQQKKNADLDADI